MKGFNDLEFKTHSFHNGVISRLYFNNGYGVSVVKHEYSYGGKEGFFELAILNSNGELVYDTPITNDVLGWLTDERVSEIMKEVQLLKAE